VTVTTISERATTARLHQNESPYGATAAIVEAAAAALAGVSRYPDADRRLVTEAVAARWDVTCEQVAVGSGIDELVLLSALATGRRSLPGLITEGTFNGYRKTLAATGRGFRAVPLRGTRVDDAGIAASLPRVRDRLRVQPAQPNRPSS
jgi:histidinol-phosphate aminotransferase